jgi:hypothetical protein
MQQNSIHREEEEICVDQEQRVRAAGTDRNKPVVAVIRVADNGAEQGSTYLET